jgi:uncharacterized protein YceH (UPF0502 family)
VSEETSAHPEKPQPAWKPLTDEQRRIVGVLVEKAKTTPDAYPLTLNSLTTGCNQKSNRNPQMNIAAEDVEVELEELKRCGAVTEIQSAGRTAKFRHNLYQWLGVDKTELAVMAELLLRGEQTIGELRGRAARMEPIADIGALKPILQSLIEKGLVQSLTPEGRGQIVSHALYLPEEQSDLQARAVELASNADEPTAARSASSSGNRAPSGVNQLVADLQQQIEMLTEELEQLRKRVELLETN